MGIKIAFESRAKAREFVKKVGKGRVKDSSYLGKRWIVVI